MMKKWFATFISTFFYVGKIPFMPGTWGTAAGMLPILFIFYQPHDFQSNDGDIFFAVGSGVISPDFILYILAILSCILYIIGQITAEIYARETKKEDPKEVVIDEVSGIFTSVTLSALIYAILVRYDRGEYLLYISLSGYFFLAQFILFRFFDIVKPWPTGALDRKCKGGFGIMIDDQAAAIQATMAFYAIFFTLKYSGYLDSLISLE